MKKNKIEVIIFDFDDVLRLSFQKMMLNLEMARDKLGLEEINEEVFLLYKNYWGQPYDVLLNSLVKLGWKKNQIAELNKFIHDRNTDPEDQALIDGVEILLSSLKNRGYTLFLNTNRREGHFYQYFSSHFALELFDHIQLCESDIIRKPNPRMLQKQIKIIRDMRLNPYNTLFVGDSWHSDYRLVQNFNTGKILREDMMHFLGVATGPHGADKFSEHQIPWIKNINDLPKMLGLN